MIDSAFIEMVSQVMTVCAFFPESSVENGTWDSVRQGWRQVFGGYEDFGYSIEPSILVRSTASHFSKSFSEVFGYLPREGGRQGGQTLRAAG